MKRHIIFLGIFVWCYFTINLYSNVDSLRAVELYQLAEKNHEKEADYLKYGNLAYPKLKQFGIWDFYLETLRGLSNCYFNKGDFQRADYFSNLLNKELITISVIPLADKFSAMLALTIYHYRKANYELAIKLSEDAIALIPKEQKDSFDLARAYINLGAICTTKGDEFKAFKYYQEALKIYHQKESTSYIVSALCNNISTFYLNQKDFFLAKNYLNKAVRLVSFLPKTEQHTRALMKYYRSLGTCYNHLGMVDSSMFFLQKVLTEPDLPTSYYADANKTIGILYKENKHPEKALSTFEIALEQYRIAFSDKHPNIAETHLNIGVIYQQLKRDSLALFNYQLAIGQLVKNFDGLSNYAINPSLKTEISSKTDLIKILYRKASIQRGIDNPEDALTTINLATQLIAQLRTTYQSTRSKVFLNEHTQQIIELGIKINIELFEETKRKAYLTKALEFSEQYKATLLQEAILELKLLDKLELPDTINYELASLKNNISFYTRKIEETANDSKKQLVSERFELEEQLRNLEAKIESNYPNYNSLLDAINQHHGSMEGIQKQITNNQALIEYFHGDSTIYTFLITKNDLQITQAPKANIAQKITNFRAVLNNPTNNASSLQQFQQKGKELYQILLEKSLKNLPPAINELIIIRDGDLFALPFEVLIQQVNPEAISWDDLTYLQNDFTISYALSATLLMNQQQKKATQFNQEFIGFAPLFNGNSTPLASRSCSIDSLNKLDFNELEINHITQLIGGNAINGKEATKANFLQQIKDTRLLHLATHACIDDQNPDQSRIYFTDDYFYLHELYNLDVKAEMVVLSACETGIGEYQHGEGMMSLAHGFAYAGVPSITTSLWAVNDKTTAELMQYYYRHLKEELPKHEALRQAKLDYLQNQESSQLQHPYYWASFVHVGDFEPIFSNRPAWRLGALGLIGLVLVGLFFRNKRNSIS